MENILVENHDSIATLTINRPEKLNTLSLETLRELNESVRTLLDRKEIRVVVITGAGEKAFVAGADVSELAKLNPIQAKSFAQLGQKIFELIENGGKPFIAAVNGYALGGGCELSLACSIRIASENAIFAQPEIKLGIVTGWGGSQRLVRLIGKSRALELCLLGEQINARKAMDWGLVSRIAPLSRLMDEAMSMANTLAAYSPMAIKFTMETIHRAAEAASTVGLLYETNLFGLCFSSDDTKERMSAFLNKKLLGK